MNELEGLKVYGETLVGWCRGTPPSESVDERGNPVLHRNGFNAADPRAPRVRVYDDPEVCKLREHLRLHNGIRGLEIVEPHEIDRAARIFFRDGFVVVRDLLDKENLERWRDGCARALKQILEVPGIGGRKYMTESFRLPHRYSYGTSSASRHMLHEPVWASMIDLPTTTPILAKIFGSRKYWVVGAGGDLCLPGAIEYQALHVDVRERETYKIPDARLRQARRLGIELRKHQGTREIDRSSWQLVIERTPPMVTINFLMTDLTWENGPIRQIPGTQGRVANPPSPSDEPEWMRLSTLVGAPAGAGVFRDSRAWHGATPNVGKEIRAMPNVEYGAPWMDDKWFAPSMPHEIWKTLSPHAQRISRRIKTASGGCGPQGQGVMHPLSSRRDEAKARGARGQRK